MKLTLGDHATYETPEGTKTRWDLNDARGWRGHFWGTREEAEAVVRAANNHKPLIDALDDAAEGLEAAAAFMRNVCEEHVTAEGILSDARRARAVLDRAKGESS